MAWAGIVLAAALPVFDFATNSVAQRIVRSDPADGLSRFVNYPNCFGGRRATRSTTLRTLHSALNTNFWLKDVDFSCVSPWSDECGAVRAGTLISKRHVIFAKHFPLWKGCRMLFVDQGGEVCPCRIAATKALPHCDIMIGSLDYEVTPNIHPAKILPEDFAKYIGSGRGLPIVTFNQREQTILSEVQSTDNGVRNAVSSNENWRAYGGRIVTGDSGNPAFLLIGNEPILLYCLYSGGKGHGPSVFHWRKEIQAAMDDLCPGYKLEAFDFSKVKLPTSEKGN